jgi:DNA (cytosine-5)-methyltransferase 1
VSKATTKRRNSGLTVTDQFCGAGGSSIGAEDAGATLVMAVNHWRLAIETHNTNFPEAHHDCADVSQVDPRRYPSTDILITSPECTNQTTAKNHRQAAAELKLWDPKEEAERSRATMWDVPRFAEVHDYEVVIVENVIESRSWRPHRSWLQAMDDLGYDHQLVYLNSMCEGTVPQSRDRLYTVFHKKGNRRPDLDIAPECWCAACSRAVPGVQTWKSDFDEVLARATKKRGKRPDRIRWGQLGSQYDYRCPTCEAKVEPITRPALDVLDFSIPTTRIGDRETPLAQATLDRIARGIAKYGDELLVVPLHHSNDPNRLPKPATEPFETWTGRNDRMLATPFLHQLAGHAFERENSTCRSRSVHDPLRTQTGTMSEGVVMIPLPMIDMQRNHGRTYPATEPTPTFCGGGNHVYLVEQPGREGFIVRNFGDPKGAQDWMVRRFDEPLSAITAGGQYGGCQQGVVQLPMVDTFHGNGATPEPVTEPLTTATAKHRHGLVEPAGVDVEGCYYRMLEPPEIGRAMSFPDTYTVLGNKRDKVRQYGNAVTPPAMKLLMERAVASLN